jgi:hypothetical protein
MEVWDVSPPTYPVSVTACLPRLLVYYQFASRKSHFKQENRRGNEELNVLIPESRDLGSENRPVSRDFVSPRLQPYNGVHVYGTDLVGLRHTEYHMLYLKRHKHAHRFELSRATEFSLSPARERLAYSRPVKSKVCA